MAILYFSDILKKVGLDPKKVKLIRHALSDKGSRNVPIEVKYMSTLVIRKKTLAKDMITGLYSSAEKALWRNFTPFTKSEIVFRILQI